MSPFEIFVAVLLLVTIPPFTIRIVNNLVKKLVRDKEKLTQTLNQIQNAFSNGFKSLNRASMTAAEIKKIEIKKSKFLAKIGSLIRTISECSSIPMTNLDIYDKVLETNCTIRVLPNDEIQETVFFSDYTFALSIVKELIEETKFPKKDEYIKLNSLYKQYKKMKNGKEKGKENEKL